MLKGSCVHLEVVEDLQEGRLEGLICFFNRPFAKDQVEIGDGGGPNCRSSTKEALIQKGHEDQRIDVVEVWRT